MIGVISAGGGKGVGGWLTVTAPANTDVTAKMGNRIRVQNSGADGKVIFRGLESGNWEISISNGDQTVTIPITITANFSMAIDFFGAKIAVTYPAGSACTCTNGSTTYTAPDTSGSYTFTVPKTGTWTVKCTNGSSTASKDVSITAGGQNVSVALSYWAGELFPTGTDGDSLTGGWDYSMSTSGSVSFENGISWSGTNVTTYVFTKKPVNVTGYKKLCFSGYLNTTLGNAAFGVSSTKTGWSSSMQWVAKVSGESCTNGSVDISRVNGNYYIVAYVSSEYGSGIGINKIWLE